MKAAWLAKNVKMKSGRKTSRADLTTASAARLLNSFVLSACDIIGIINGAMKWRDLMASRLAEKGVLAGRLSPKS